MRNRPSCLPVRRGSGRRSRSGASPFGAHKKGGAPPLIGGCRKDKLKKRLRIRKTTRVYAVVCSPQQRFLCAGMMHARHPATRGFSARGYSFDAHGTDGRHGLGFAGLPRGLQAHPLGNNIFFARKAKRARAKGCSGTRAALLTTCPPDKHIRTPRAGTPPTLLYGEHQVCIFAPVSFEKNTAARRLYNRKHPRSRSEDAAPRMARPHTEGA